MENIYLVGFMGSGKSTVGRIIADRLKMEFVDVDSLIEKETGKSIPQIFREKGEAYFRQIEKRMLAKLTEKNKVVVSTGGGLGADRENMEKMKKTGFVVWLDVSLEEILRRTKGDTERPLLKQPLEAVKKLYNSRKKVYALADVHIKAEGKTPQQTAQEIIDEYLHRHRHS
ncbi:shikimate kinase [Persephonella sp.]